MPDQKMPKVVTNFHKVSSWLNASKVRLFSKVLSDAKQKSHKYVVFTGSNFSFVNFIDHVYICIFKQSIQTFLDAVPETSPTENI